MMTTIPFPQGHWRRTCVCFTHSSANNRAAVHIAQQTDCRAHARAGDQRAKQLNLLVYLYDVTIRLGTRPNERFSANLFQQLVGSQLVLLNAFVCQRTDS